MSDITPADALRELGDDQAEYAAAAAKKALLESFNACDCYPGGFTPDSFEGPQEHCPVHGRDAEHTEAPVITLCGSTRFKAEFMEANQRLTMAGNVVVSLGVFGHTDLPDYDWTEASSLKRTLDRIHLQKIRMADEVYIIDPGGYVGESTRREIAYAESLGKPVRYLSAEVTP